MLVTVTFEVDIPTDSVAEAEAAGWYMRMRSQHAWPHGRQYLPASVEVEEEEEYAPTRVLRGDES